MVSTSIKISWKKVSLARVTRSPGVYGLLFSKRLIYVGEAQNLFSRINEGHFTTVGIKACVFFHRTPAVLIFSSEAEDKQKEVRLYKESLCIEEFRKKGYTVLNEQNVARKPRGVSPGGPSQKYRNYKDADVQKTFQTSLSGYDLRKLKEQQRLAHKSYHTNKNVVSRRCAFCNPVLWGTPLPLISTRGYGKVVS